MKSSQIKKKELWAEKVGGRGYMGEEKKTLTIEGQGVWEKNYEPRTLSWSWVGIHPIQDIPKRDFLDGALVGDGSLKPNFCGVIVSIQHPRPKMSHLF
jgi:hypothetical protein